MLRMTALIVDSDACGFSFQYRGRAGRLHTGCQNVGRNVPPGVETSQAKEERVSAPSKMSVEEEVRKTYARGAQERVDALCCPVQYDPRYLEVIPREVLDRDYGCGDPSRHLGSGETVLDLGSGTGKICFIAAQVVGAGGRVIGVDVNDEMLGVARRAAPQVAQRLGYANVEFRKGRIEDLREDTGLLESFLVEHPVRSTADLFELEAARERLKAERPLVSDASVDVVVSNCVLNLVRPGAKAALFAEIFRVLKKGGRAVISDIVSDEDVPAHLQTDPALWSGCVSGAFREDLFLAAFEEAGFHGIRVLERQAEPWRTVEGIEFRSLTVVAWKGKQGPCLDRKHALVYRGPFRQVEDDDGHLFRRGARVAVCEKTFRLLTSGAYPGHFDAVEPRTLVPLDKAPPFACTGGARLRSPRETKGDGYDATTDPCDPSGGCC
jgi:arsenite methyltransferase